MAATAAALTRKRHVGNEGILLPAIKLDLDLSDTQIGFVTGAALTIFYALLGVPIASLADRYSRKKIIAWALVLWSGMACLYGLAKSFLQLAVFRVLVGIGEAGCTPPNSPGMGLDRRYCYAHASR